MVASPAPRAVKDDGSSACPPPSRGRGRGGGDASRALIVGGGPAGDAAAAGLRDAGFSGEVVLVGAEPELPYERPHLSKGYLLGKVTRERLPLRPAGQYKQLDVTLRLGERIVELDSSRRTARLEGGQTVGWDVLCLATGSGARRLPGFEDGLYLRELPDAERLRSLLEARASLNLIGAGFIGCEVAAAARLRGCEVVVHEALEQPLQRILGAELGAYLAGVHRDHGVHLRLGEKDVKTLAAPVVVGVGSQPRIELAERAGLPVDGGILVDELGRTPAEGIYAAGDATRFWSSVYESRIRVEHFQTAQRHGFAVGRAMGGASEPFVEVPWFWSDQYDLNLQYAGAGLPWDSVVIRGRFGLPPFSTFYLDNGRLVAVAGINDSRTVSRARRLIQSRAEVSPQKLADPSFDLRRGLA